MKRSTPRTTLKAQMILLLIVSRWQYEDANRTALRTGDPFFARPTLAAEKGEGGKAEVVSHGQENDGSCRHVRGGRKNEQGANLICIAFALFLSSFLPPFVCCCWRTYRRKKKDGRERMTRRHDDKSKGRDGGNVPDQSPFLSICLVRGVLDFN